MKKARREECLFKSIFTFTFFYKNYTIPGILPVKEGIAKVTSDLNQKKNVNNWLQGSVF